jgi:hypothetical protein
MTEDHFMRWFKRLASPLALIALVAISVFGCGRLPTAPTVQSDATPTVSRAAQPEGLLSGIGGIVNALVGLLVRTLNLVGSLGGSLTNGRWRVVVPAGAVDGSATVAIGVANTSSPDCKLEIWPSDKNHFSVAAMLTVDCRNVASDQLANYAIYWFDASANQWVELSGSKVNLTNKTVSVSILHFSQYSVGPKGGKAGW